MSGQLPWKSTRIQRRWQLFLRNHRIRDVLFFIFIFLKSFFPATKLSPAPAAACEVHTSLTRAGLLQGAVGEEDYVNSTITLLLRSQ